jgi:hypothetical protein
VFYDLFAGETTHPVLCSPNQVRAHRDPRQLFPKQLELKPWVFLQGIVPGETRFIGEKYHLPPKIPFCYDFHIFGGR